MLCIAVVLPLVTYQGILFSVIPHASVQHIFDIQVVYMLYIQYLFASQAHRGQTINSLLFVFNLESQSYFSSYHVSEEVNGIGLDCNLCVAPPQCYAGYVLQFQGGHQGLELDRGQTEIGQMVG